ncbi:MAG: MerR family transcriptional regulator [Proteobacteria bacterium]|nr:MerR family transcriptional regulator [Pseudomonadota bacterium]
MNQKTLTGILLDEGIDLSLNDLSRACSSSIEWVIELVDEGVLEPIGHEQAGWRFPGTSLQKARVALRLQQDLGINLAGVALALDMLDEIDTLRARLCWFEINDI